MDEIFFHTSTLTHKITDMHTPTFQGMLHSHLLSWNSTHTYTRTHTRTRTSTYTHTYINKYTYTHTCTGMLSSHSLAVKQHNPHLHTHPPTHTHTQTHTLGLTRDIPTYLHPYILYSHRTSPVGVVLEKRRGDSAQIRKGSRVRRPQRIRRAKRIRQERLPSHDGRVKLHAVQQLEPRR